MSIMTEPFVGAEALDALSDIACQPPEELWNWDANTYMRWREVEPFICLDGLDDHSPVLLGLVRMAPNGDLNEFELTNGLMRLHDAFDIFPEDGSAESELSLSTRAAVASVRWRVMCQQCLMLVKSNYNIPDRYEKLKEVLAAIQLPESEPTAATASVTDSLPALDDTTPQCSMALPDQAPPDNDTPILMPKREKTNTERKPIVLVVNAIQPKEKRYLELSGERADIQQESEGKHRKLEPEILEIKNKVGECRNRRSNTWEFQAVVKTRYNLTTLGVDLVSWGVLNENHSLYLIGQSIRYGLIPYVPFITKRGQKTTWPESYDFVADPKYWKHGWQDYPPYCGLKDSA